MGKLFKKMLSLLNVIFKRNRVIPKKQKAFKIREFKELTPQMGGCIATAKITVEGLPVKYMYRETSDHECDSGWRFFSGTETQEYIDDLSNSGVYSLNTIANYDESITPYLEYPFGVELEKDEQTGRFNLIPG